MGVNGIYGLSGSGLDIESLVKVGMMSKQNEYDKMAQKYTKNEWTKTALLDLSNQITTFNLSSLTDYKLSSTMNARTATSSDETAVTATSNATSPIMSHKVDVSKLSYNAYLIGSNNVSDIIYKTKNGTVTNEQAEKLADNAKLSDILFQNLSDGSHNVTSTLQSPVAVTSGTITLANEYTTTNLTDNGDGTYSGSITGGLYSKTYADSNGTKLLTNGRTTYLKEVSTSTFSNGKVTETAITQNGPTTTSYSVDIYETDPYSGALTTTTKTYTAQDDGSYKASDGSILAKNGDNFTITDSTDTDNPQQIYFTRGSKTVVEDRTITFNQGTTIKTTSTNESGTKTITAATTTTSESGYAGTTLNSLDTSTGTLTAARSNVSAGYSNGQYPLVQGDDIAMQFKIGDGTTNTETISFTYDDINGGKTMNDLVSKINAATTNAGINVKAAYDNVNGRFSIYNTDGNKDSKVEIMTVDNKNVVGDASSARNYSSQITQNFFNALGLKQFDGTSLSSAAKTLSGSSAISVSGGNGEIIVDGLAYETKDNKVTVGGVTYTATNTTGVATLDANGKVATFQSSGAATVTVGQDVDGIVDKVKSFVESYNKILGSLYDAYNEKPESGYTPLTQSQKDTLKEEQIEKWEEKAKKGLLYHDQTLYKIINNMRNAISNEVEGLNSKYDSAYSIGISTTGIYGQLVLDEDKLKKALAEDSDAAYNVFGKLVTTTDSTGKLVTDTEKSGVAQRLSDVFASATKSIRTRAGSSADITEDSDLNNLLRELQTKMSNFKKLMSAFEDKLYKKYDAMEVALSRLGTQLNFITGGQ